MTDATEHIETVDEPTKKRTARAKKSDSSAMAKPNERSSDKPDENARSASSTASRKVNHSQPIFEQKLTIHSLQGQRVMDRSFRALSGSLFRLEVILRIVGEEQAIDAAEAEISKSLGKAQEEIAEGLAGARALMQANGLTSLPTYTNVKKYTVQIKTPQIANFARLVVQLDELMSLIDALWIMGQVIPSKERIKQTWDWQQRLIRLAGQIINLERRAREAAYRKGMADEVELAAPTSQLEADAQLLEQHEDALVDTSDQPQETAQMV